jgi:tRNA(Arg) A34 adenosine deaminase TadA
MKEYSNHIPFPYLPEGKEIEFVDENNPFMQIALEEKKKSNDQLYPTGAVVVKESKVIGKAHNRSGYKWKWLIKLHQDGFCPRRWFKIKTGQKYWMCLGCATYEKHSESTIVNNFEKENRLEELSGADIYLSGHWWCCKQCWDNMIRARIKTVFLMKGAKEKFDNRTW